MGASDGGATARPRPGRPRPVLRGTAERSQRRPTTSAQEESGGQPAHDHGERLVPTVRTDLVAGALEAGAYRGLGVGGQRRVGVHRTAAAGHDRSYRLPRSASASSRTRHTPRSPPASGAPHRWHGRAQRPARQPPSRSGHTARPPCGRLRPRRPTGGAVRLRSGPRSRPRAAGGPPSADMPEDRRRAARPVPGLRRGRGADGGRRAVRRTARRRRQWSSGCLRRSGRRGTSDRRRCAGRSGPGAHDVAVPLGTCAVRVGAPPRDRKRGASPNRDGGEGSRGRGRPAPEVGGAHRHLPAHGGHGRPITRHLRRAGAEQLGSPTDPEEAGHVEWVPPSDISALMARGDLMGSSMLVALLHIVASHRKEGPATAD